MKAFWASSGAISGMISVILGAFAAHALSSRLAEKSLSAFQTGVQYQMTHSLALLAVLALLPLSASLTQATLWCFLVGIVLFSGSLYILALSGIKTWGMVTPIGGVLFIVGWLLFAIQAVKVLGNGK